MIGWAVVNTDNSYVCVVKNCARCGGSHAGVKFLPFRRPPTDIKATHWASCPDNQEPILFRVNSAPCGDCYQVGPLLEKDDHHGGKKWVCKDRRACNQRRPG